MYLIIYLFIYPLTSSLLYFTLLYFLSQFYIIFIILFRGNKLIAEEAYSTGQLSEIEYGVEFKV